MPDTLAMLNPEDWATLRELATSVTYRRGEVLLEEGVRNRALFIVRDGTVRAEHLHEGHPITLAHIGPGEVFGEMGFVENTVASASIVAEDEVTVDRIDDGVLQAVLISTPGFAIRFYHSLAAALSQRLRATSRRLAHAGAGEAAQVNRYHVPHTGNASPRQIPDALDDGIDRFAWLMRELEQGLQHRTLKPDDAQVQLNAACDDLIELVRSLTASDPLIEMGWEDLLAFRDPETLEAGVGDHVFRASFPFLMVSATIARCYARPRGFPEDHETVAMIYRDEPSGDGHLGPMVDRWFLERPFCTARRAGRRHVRETLEGLIDAWPSSELVRVAAAASGFAGEIFDIFAAEAGARLIVTCIDIDEKALLAAARLASRRNLGDRISFLQASAIPESGLGPAIRSQHVISAYGLLEYVSDEDAVDFLDWAHAHLVHGGTVLVSQLEAANPDRPLMEHVINWKLNYRTVKEVQALVARSQFGAGEGSNSTTLADGQIFATCVKDASGAR
jgi:CRP-like cAMP-binding protein